MAYFTKYVCDYELENNNILLLNTLTSAVDIVDKVSFINVRKMIKNINDVIDLELYNTLKKRGYIFESEDEERNILKRLNLTNKKILKNTISTDFKICPTMGCNLRCTYCYQDHIKHVKYNCMSNEQLNIIFSYIKGCRDFIRHHKLCNIPIRIGLFGGEPLLNSNYKSIERILAFIEKIDSNLYITTNGVTISEYYDLLSRYKNRIFIQITLDGSKFDHNKRRIYSSGYGTFDKICRGIRLILKLKIKLTVRINVDKKNINNIGDLEDLFDKNYWSQNPLFHTYATPIRCYEQEDVSKDTLTDSEILDFFMKNGWYGSDTSFINRMDSSVYDVVFRLFNRDKVGKSIPWQITYCAASQGSQYVFTPDGVISTCLKCAGERKYNIGNFDKKGIALESDKLNLWKGRDPFEIDKCKDCKFILLCAGGCPYYALKNYKDINCGVCNDIENTLKVYVKYMGKKLLHNSIVKEM